MTEPDVLQASKETASVPLLAWDAVAKYVDKNWNPETDPHHSIVSQTGGGKSYLAINGVLKHCCAWDKVLIIDVKRDDKLVSTSGRPVSHMPTGQPWYQGAGQKRQKYDKWFRLPVPYDRDKARLAVYDALAQVYREGDWVVFFDELHYVTSQESKEFLGLRGPVEKLYRLGRNKHISIIAATQSPRYVPGSFYDQASWAWIGRIRDEQRQKRLLEIGGMSRKELPYVASLRKRQFMLCGPGEEGEWFARTQVTV
jgi:DNA helicase HerA-like ATPase